MKSNEYTLLDSGHFKKLEQVGPYRLIRPASQCPWKPKKNKALWQSADAEFFRIKEKESYWTFYNKGMPKEWPLSLNTQQLWIKLTDFGHIGIFPEHLCHEKQLTSLVSKHKSTTPLKVLNLFAHTGALSILMAKLGVHITHVDSSKSSLEWAKKNSHLSKTPTQHIRWILDDVQKFVKREERRQSLYHGVILDPPSFGRGNKNELWKIETHLPLLLKNLTSIMADNFYFIILTAHTPGFTPTVLINLLQDILPNTQKISGHEMFITEKESKRNMPCGAYAIYEL